MISDPEFVTQSITLNLFYLSNIRGFCLNIQLAFLDKKYIEKANQFFLETENIMNIFIDKVGGLIPVFALNSNFIVTEYTYDIDRLTEKLFNIDLSRSITNKLLSLKTSLPRIPDANDVILMTNINERTYDLATNYIEFLKEIFTLEVSNNLFSYSSPFVIKTVINIVEIHKQMLKRTMNKMAANPTSVLNYEYYIICFFKSCAAFLCSIVNPSREDIYLKANSFNKEFHVLEVKYSVAESNPDELKNLTIIAKKLIIRYSLFLKDIIEDILNKKAYFLVEPSFLDDIYRIVNYIIYNLNILEVK